MKIFISYPMKSSTYIGGCAEHAFDLEVLAKNINPTAEVVNPWMNIPNGTREDYWRESNRLLLDCDAILLGLGWETADGCDFEYKTARALGKKILFQYPVVVKK
jgi:hypothetical protein